MDFPIKTTKLHGFIPGVRYELPGHIGQLVRQLLDPIHQIPAILFGVRLRREQKLVTTYDM